LDTEPKAADFLEILQSAMNLQPVEAQTERLQKIISQWGIASRRQAEDMILQGRVQVNGVPAQLGQRANPERDRIEVDHQLIQPAERPKFIYLLLHKPVGVVSTCSDPQGRRTVLDLLPPTYHQQGLHPVGRLDIDSTGAILLTNDGALTHCLTHPRHHISKTYQVRVQGYPQPSVLQRWRQGVALDGRMTLPAQVKILRPPRGQQASTPLEITLQEGRNRQIRRVAEQLGYPVISLHRVGIGSVQLNHPKHGELPVGKYRHLTGEEIKGLLRLMAMRSHVGTASAGV
jgi:23S rRNA pseudouridine2605 synthase